MRGGSRVAPREREPLPAAGPPGAEAPPVSTSQGRPRASGTRRAGDRLAPMARTTAVRLTGEDLTVADVWEVAVEGASVELDDSARKKMAAARALVERVLADEGPTYGVTTGFGRFVSTPVPGE